MVIFPKSILRNKFLRIITTISSSIFNQRASVHERLQLTGTLLSPEITAHLRGSSHGRTTALVPVERCVHTLESESHLATGIVRDDNDGVVIVVSGDGVGVMMVDLLICYLSDRHSIISPGDPSHQHNHARCVNKTSDHCIGRMKFSMQIVCTQVWLVKCAGDWKAEI